MWLLALLVSHAMAQDTWFCTTQSSHVSGNQIQACGLGKGQNEETARMAALEDAKLEFQELCSMADNCKNKRIIVEPGRTTCGREGPYWRCDRMFIYTLN